MKELLKNMRNGIGKGVGIGIGVLLVGATALLAQVVIQQFSAGENLTAQKLNDTFNALKVAIEDINVGAGKSIRHNGTPVAGYLDDGTPYFRKVVPIGSWNMVATQFKSVPHGLDDSKIIRVTAMIHWDNDTTSQRPLGRIGWTGVQEGGAVLIAQAGNISLGRPPESEFASALNQYSSTSFNRGFVVIDCTL